MFIFSVLVVEYVQAINNFTQSYILGPQMARVAILYLVLSGTSPYLQKVLMAHTHSPDPLSGQGIHMTKYVEL